MKKHEIETIPCDPIDAIGSIIANSVYLKLGIELDSITPAQKFRVTMELEKFNDSIDSIRGDKEGPIDDQDCLKLLELACRQILDIIRE